MTGTNVTWDKYRYPLFKVSKHEALSIKNKEQIPEMLPTHQLDVADILLGTALTDT